MAADVKQSLADPEDSGEAAERLERALARIGDAATRLQALRGASAAESGPTTPVIDPETASDLAARLDAIIARLRTALADPSTD